MLKATALAVCGLGGAGAYMMTAPSGSSVVRIVEKSPGSAFAAYDAALKPLSAMPAREVHTQDGPGSMTFSYTAKPGEEADLTANLNGRAMFDLKFAFAPADTPSRTTMTVTLTPTRSAPMAMRAAFASSTTGALERLVDATVGRVELGLPLTSFGDLGGGDSGDFYGYSEGTPRATTGARPMSNPDEAVRNREYDMRRAQEQAAAPTTRLP